jgi:hypothetical protein
MWFFEEAFRKKSNVFPIFNLDIPMPEVKQDEFFSAADARGMRIKYVKERTDDEVEKFYNRFNDAVSYAASRAESKAEILVVDDVDVFRNVVQIVTPFILSKGFKIIVDSVSCEQPYYRGNISVSW